MNISSIVCVITRAAKSRVVFIVWIFGLCIVSGCSADERPPETRRAFAIQFNKERLATSKNEVQKKWSKDILSALTATNASTTTIPTIASAVLVNRKNGDFGLFVYWIESRPSVDAVEFRFSNQTPPQVIPIPEVILKQNQASAKDTIVFGSEFEWKATSELWKSLESITSAKNLEIRLMRAKAPTTGWFAVDFYKADKWIGNARTPDAK